MDFFTPLRLEDALSLLERYPDYTILAGGTDLAVHRRRKKITPIGYLDVTRIPELREIRTGKTLWIGAAVTCGELERDPALRRFCPLISAAAAAVGSPQIRSRATIGGNAANASPAADLVPALVAADASVVLASAGETRQMSITEFILGSGKTALHAGELILGFEMPRFTERTRWNYDKIGRRNALAISRMNGAFVCEWKDETLQNVRICIGAVTNRPRRCRPAEQILEGQHPDPLRLSQAGKAVREDILAQTGMRASSAYKLPVSEALTARLLGNAVKGAGV